MNDQSLLVLALAMESVMLISLCMLFYQLLKQPSGPKKSQLEKEKRMKVKVEKRRAYCSSFLLSGWLAISFGVAFGQTGSKWPLWSSLAGPDTVERDGAWADDRCEPGCFCTVDVG